MYFVKKVYHERKSQNISLLTEWNMHFNASLVLNSLKVGDELKLFQNA